MKYNVKIEHISTEVIFVTIKFMILMMLDEKKNVSHSQRKFQSNFDCSFGKLKSNSKSNKPCCRWI